MRIIIRRIRRCSKQVFADPVKDQQRVGLCPLRPDEGLCSPGTEITGASDYQCWKMDLGCPRKQYGF